MDEVDFMLVKIRREAFSSLGNAELGWVCIEPTLQKIPGKNPTIKAQAYSELTTGQQALLMFRVLYDHAKNSEAEFYSWINILINQPGTWSEIKVGLKYFEDDSTVQFLDEVKSYLKKNSNIEAYQESDFLNEGFYPVFCRIAQKTVNLIGTYIRNNPEEFVRFMD